MLGLTWRAYPARERGLLPHSENRMKTWMQADEQFIERLREMGFHVTDVPGDGFCVWHAVAKSLDGKAETLHRKVLNHMAERSGLHSQFIVEYNITKYKNVLDRLDTDDGWNTGMGDMVSAGIATGLRRVIVVFTINHSIFVSPLEGKVNARSPPLLVAYVPDSHFMHVEPKSQFGRSRRR